MMRNIMLLKIRIDQGKMTVVATPVGRNPLFAFHRVGDEPYYRVTHILTGGKMPGWYSSQKSARAAALKARPRGNTRCTG